MEGSVIESYEYLRKSFPPDFISSIPKDNFLHRLLLEKYPKFDIWRKQIDDCLELAYRYNLVNTDFKGRILKGDWESWTATMSELKIAKHIEELFGLNCLSWRPQGRERKVGEFELTLDKIETPIFIEVKTILPRPLERLEQRIADELRSCVKDIRMPFGLSMHLENAGDRDGFSRRSLKDFLIRELNKVKVREKTTSYSLSDYRDENTGLHLTRIEAYPYDKSHSNMIYLGFNARWGGSSEFIKHSLDKAREKKPDSTFLVILCPSPNYLIDEVDILNAWLGTEKMIITFDEEGKAISDEMVRTPDGFFKHKEISAFGVYTEDFKGDKIEENLIVYHNPLAAFPMDISIFSHTGVKQLIKKNETEMEWLD